MQWNSSFNTEIKKKSQKKLFTNDLWVLRSDRRDLTLRKDKKIVRMKFESLISSFLSCIFHEAITISIFKLKKSSSHHDSNNQLWIVDFE